jgi:OOP family OmpA-OmpF porin
MTSRPFTRTLLVVALLAGGIGAAQAEGLYVGGALGKPHYGDPIAGVGGSGSGTTGKLFGGYEFTPNVALEAGWADLGHTDDAAGRVEARALYLDAVGRYELVPQWSLLGSVGVADGRFKSSTQGNDSSPALKLGLGAQYDFTKSVALRLQYDHYHFSDAFDAKPNVGAYTVGVKFGF